MIRLLANPLLPWESCLFFLVFLCVAGRAYWRKGMGWGGVSEEPNHTTERKPGPLLIIQYSLLCPLHYPLPIIPCLLHLLCTSSLQPFMFSSPLPQIDLPFSSYISLSTCPLFKETVSRAGLSFWRHKWIDLGQNFSDGPPNLHSPPTNGKQGSIPEEMCQTLLSNKKQGNLDKVHAAKIGAPKKCNKNGPVPYLGL